MYRYNYTRFLFTNGNKMIKNIFSVRANARARFYSKRHNYLRLYKKYTGFFFLICTYKTNIYYNISYCTYCVITYNY